MEFCTLKEITHICSIKYSKMTAKKDHWEQVFATKQEQEVSWYQSKPETSLRFFSEFEVPKNAAIIDVGGGDSYLIDGLLAAGYSQLTLLDISENAIKRAQKRMAEHATHVRFLASDSVEFKRDASFEVWHDRASFHFLTSEDAIERYRNNVIDSLRAKGLFIVGTFSEKGPLKCSGLDITQYTEAKLKVVFEPELELLTCFTEEHTTPFNTVQDFIFAVFRKR